MYKASVDTLYHVWPHAIHFENVNKHLITIVDDYIKICWFYLLKKKFEAYETFKKFHVWIKNEARSQIGTLSNDNGK